MTFEHFKIFTEILNKLPTSKHDDDSTLSIHEKRIITEELAKIKKSHKYNA